MADNPEASGDNQITFKVKTSGDSSHVITISENVTVLDLKTKLSGADFENIPVERQRLIYSGRVMKNDDTLSTYKIKNNNTIHMVKSAASNANQSASTSSTTPTPQAPQNMASGTANNPLAGLTGARYAGHQINMPNLDMFGPDGGMGPPMDEERMQRMMADPNVQQSMNEALNNPDVVNMLIDSHPMLRNMPNAREIIQSPFMRQMMSNPQMMSQAMRMQRSMQGGDSAFPAPGATDTTPEGTAAGGNAQGSNQNQNQQNPFGNPFMNPFLMPGLMGNQQGGQGGNNQNQPDLGAVLEQLRQLNSLGLNPFGNMQNQGQTATGQAGTATTPSQGATGSEGATQTEGNNPREGGAQQGTSSPPPANPFAALFGGAGGNANPFGGTQGNAANPFGINPEMMQQMMQMFGGGGGSPAPQDNRPPEERYEEQLRQLNDMGFFDFDRNVAALRRSGGSVQGAVEFLLSGN